MGLSALKRDNRNASLIIGQTLLSLICGDSKQPHSLIPPVSQVFALPVPVGMIHPLVPISAVQKCEIRETRLLGTEAVRYFFEGDIRPRSRSSMSGKDVVALICADQWFRPITGKCGFLLAQE
jgi:hypothetical protein